MNSKQIKAEGMKKTKEWFQSLGVNLYKPIGYNPVVDMIAEFNGKAQRIRVKATEKSKDGIVRFDMNSALRHSGTKPTDVRKEIDYYALYSIDRNKLYLIDVHKAPTTDITIRFENSKKNSKKMHFEKDVLVEKVIKK